MSKRLERDARARGEELLRSWGVGDEVPALRAAWDRDAQANAAILDRLARLPQAESVAALLEIEGATADKALRKEIRRALFRLEQRGLEVARPAPLPAAPFTAARVESEGWMSAADGRGDQLLWLVQPRRGELMQLFAVVNDPEGMRETELHPVSRKVLRSAREDLLSRHRIRMVEVDWRYCDARMAEAHRWAIERGAAIAGDYPGLRAQILSDPPAEVPHPILAVLDAGAVAAAPELLAESLGLLQEDELATWGLPIEVLRPILEEMAEAEASPLLLNEHQKRERMGQIVDRALDDLFSGAGAESYRRRLLDLAWVFHATRRAERARQALANALALESGGGRAAPLCQALLRLSLGAHIEVAQQQDEQRRRDSLILTPQEAARAAAEQRGRR